MAFVFSDCGGGSFFRFFNFRSLCFSRLRARESYFILTIVFFNFGGWVIERFVSTMRFRMCGFFVGGECEDNARIG